jgi:hypothetical protein
VVQLKSENFLNCIITGDETWVHHHESETEWRSMQWKHKSSSKESKSHAFAGKLLLTSVRQEVIDITLGSYGLQDRILDWEVSLEPSLSDHRHILFTLRGSVPVVLTRNPRATNWGSFREDL